MIDFRMNFENSNQPPGIDKEKLKKELPWVMGKEKGADIIAEKAEKIAEEMADKIAEGKAGEKVIETKLKSYICTVVALPAIIEHTRPIFKETYQVGKQRVKIEYAGVGRSAVDVKNMKLATDILDGTAKGITERDVPFIRDLDWILFTNYNLLDTKEEELSKQVLGKAPKMPKALMDVRENYYHDFSSQSIASVSRLIKILENYDPEKTRAPDISHIDDFIYNSVIAHENESNSEIMKERHETVNNGIMLITYPQTRNPRTFARYIDEEWKPFYQKVKEHCKDEIEAYVKALLEEVPQAAKYY